MYRNYIPAFENSENSRKRLKDKNLDQDFFRIFQVANLFLSQKFYT